MTALSLPLTAPVPEEYAKPFDDQTVSTYGLHQVATGPYMIKNNAAGSINGIGYKPEPADRPRPQPELGREHRLPARAAPTRCASRRATRTRP